MMDFGWRSSVETVLRCISTFSCLSRWLWWCRWGQKVMIHHWWGSGGGGQVEGEGGGEGGCFLRELTQDLPACHAATISPHTNEPCLSDGRSTIALNHWKGWKCENEHEGESCKSVNTTQFLINHQQFAFLNDNPPTPPQNESTEKLTLGIGKVTLGPAILAHFL